MNLEQIVSILFVRFLVFLLYSLFRDPLKFQFSGILSSFLLSLSFFEIVLFLFLEFCSVMSSLVSPPQIGVNLPLQVLERFIVDNLHLIDSVELLVQFPELFVNFNFRLIVFHEGL